MAHQALSQKGKQNQLHQERTVIKNDLWNALNIFQIGDIIDE